VSGSLWDAHFRARLLRQGLSNDEIVLVVDVAEEAAAERDRYRAALECIYRTGRGLHVEIARDALNA
jgi:hypothetical protein